MMVEYIEREAFLEQERKRYCEDCSRRQGMKNGKYKTLYEIGEAPCRACEIYDAMNDVEDFPAADVRPVVQRDAVMQALNNFFSIGDSYTYELTRVKEAFYVGTMTFDDFEEWNEDNVSDLCDYLMKELFCPDCGADMREGS